MINKEPRMILLVKSAKTGQHILPLKRELPIVRSRVSDTSNKVTFFGVGVIDQASCFCKLYPRIKRIGRLAGWLTRPLRAGYVILNHPIQ